MGNRSLAHIEKVVSIYPILHEGQPAENVEMVQVQDFHVVAKKNQFKVGDLALYVEVGSILKEEPAVEFLRSKKFTIKAMKFGSKFSDNNGNRIISQGILFPPNEMLSSPIVEGQDVTEVLGVTKVIEDAEEDATFGETKETFLANLNKILMRYSFYRKLKKNLFGNSIKGTWQDWMPPKSDEDNIQRIFSKWKEIYNDNNWYVSEKMEGQSISIYVVRSKYLFGLKEKTSKGVCSRTRNLVTDDGSRFWATVKELNIHETLLKLEDDYFIRGEHCGPKIQENIYKFQTHRIFIYDVWNIREQRKLNYQETVDFCASNGFEMVPILDNNYALPNTVQECLDFSNGFSKYGDKVLREGVVVRRKDNPNISSKFKSPEYMIKHNK